MLILIHHLKKLFPLKRPVFQYVSIDIHMVSFGYSLSIQHDWLVVWNMIWIIFHFIYGMPSFPLTLTPSFFKMVIAPPTRSPHDSSIQDDLDVETVPKNASVRAIERWGDDPPIRAFFSGDRRYRMGRAVSWMSCQTSKRR